MKETHCPICYTELISKEVTPCVSCGGLEVELGHYKHHVFREYELYFKQRLILCNFCDVDFGSYAPSYFGFLKSQSIGFQDFNHVREISDKELRKGKYCPECKHRLPFLNFVQYCREENEKQQNDQR